MKTLYGTFSSRAEPNDLGPEPVLIVAMSLVCITAAAILERIIDIRQLIYS